MIYPWTVADPLVIKTLLDESFAQADLNARSFIAGAAVTRGQGPDGVDVDLANVRHARRVAERLASPQCCVRKNLRPTDWDLLWLLEGLGEARIAKDLFRKTKIRGSPQDALDDIRRYDPLLEGHPLIEVSRAQAALAMASQSRDDVRVPGPSNTCAAR